MQIVYFIDLAIQMSRIKSKEMISFFDRSEVKG